MHYRTTSGFTISYHVLWLHPFVPNKCEGRIFHACPEFPACHAADYLADVRADGTENAGLQGLRHCGAHRGRTGAALLEAAGGLDRGRGPGGHSERPLAHLHGHHFCAVHLPADPGDGCYGGHQADARRHVPGRPHPDAPDRLGLRPLHGGHGRLRNRRRHSRRDPGGPGL